MIKKFVHLMQAPGVLVRMIIVAAALGILTFTHKGSLKTAIWYAVAGFILMQLGYIGGILYMAWREYARRRK